MKNFYENRRVIEAFVAGALLQYSSAVLADSNKIEAKTLKRAVKNKVNQAFFDELFVNTMAKVEEFLLTGQIPHYCTSFQAQVCLDLGRLI